MLLLWNRPTAWFTLMESHCQFCATASAAGQWWKLGGMLNFLSLCANAVPPPQQSRMGGGPSFLCKTSDSHLLQRRRGEKKMNGVCFLEASNRRRDKLRSGSRPTAVLFNTSCCLVDRDLWPEKTGSACCGPQVEVKRWVFLNVYSGQFLTIIIGINFHPASFCCYPNC